MAGRWPAATEASLWELGAGAVWIAELQWKGCVCVAGSAAVSQGGRRPRASFRCVE